MDDDVSVDQSRTPRACVTTGWVYEGGPLNEQMKGAPSFTPVVLPHPPATTGADDHQWPASGCRHGQFEGEARRGRGKGINIGQPAAGGGGGGGAGGGRE